MSSSIEKLSHGQPIDMGIKMEHTSATGRMTGVSVAPQVIDLTAGIDLVFANVDSSASPAQEQIRSSFLAIDPGTSDKIVKLPPALTANSETVEELTGKVITIWNSNGEGGFIINLQDSAGNHLCVIGCGDYKTIRFPAQGSPQVEEKISKHIFTLDQTDLLALNSTPQTIAIPASQGAIVSHAKLVYSGPGMTNSHNVQISVSSGVIVLPAGTITSAGTTIKSADAAQTPTAGADVSLSVASADPTGGAAESKLVATIYFWEV